MLELLTFGFYFHIHADRVRVDRQQIFYYFYYYYSLDVIKEMTLNIRLWYLIVKTRI
jgi:hypothetical protein